MLLREHPGGQAVGGVARHDRHHGLRQDVAVVQFCGHTVHRGPCKLAPCINGTLVRVQAGERGQQGGVDVDQTPGIVRHKTWRQDAHEAGQHHQAGLVGINRLHQGCIESGARFGFMGKGLVIHHRRVHALCLREQQTLGVGPVADDGRHLGLEALCPVVALCGAQDGGHVGAAA